jgi:3-hydroxyisobutyrate dehydrogenase
MRIVILGLGRIGLPICRRLLQAGHDVTAVDLAPDRARAAAALGARLASCATEAVAEAEAELLLTVLPGEPELRSLMLGSDAGGLLQRMPTTTTWIDLTSSGVGLAAELDLVATGNEIRWLEAPLGGGVKAAENGTLTLFTGGDEDLLRAWVPILGILAPEDQILYLGGHGSGYLAKLLVNLLWFTQAVSTAEVMLLAQAGGLELDQLRRVLMSGPASSTFISSYLPSLFNGDYLTTFGLDRCVEELNSITSTARDHGLTLDVSTLVADLHTRALERFGPVDGELMAVAYLEERAGRTIRPSP